MVSEDIMVSLCNTPNMRLGGLRTSASGNRYAVLTRSRQEEKWARSLQRWLGKLKPEFRAWSTHLARSLFVLLLRKGICRVSHLNMYLCA